MDKLLEIAQRPTLGQRMVAWASRPPGRLYLPACVVAGLLLLYADSVPGKHLPTYLLGLACGAALALMGAMRLGIALGVARPMIRRYWLRWVTAPLIAAATIALSASDIALQARVVASEEALLEVRDGLNPSTTIPLDGRRAGLYTLRAGTIIEDGVRFEVEGAGLFGPAGLAYSQSEIPTDVFVPGHGDIIYTHIDGSWYAWTEYRVR